ncbi:GNAT family N-acetyltransferase [Aureimonas sp. AU40]|uniref:GNAT family N-acetyltransferase n=1 Tax=Aureimonas sp. AU40 TaxID=1637747 RepID=UPI000780864A|nr:GNAT family N-acetyltransferase [Aureimonas sp. AU40]
MGETGWTLRRAVARDAAALFHIRTSVRENAMSLADLAAIGLTETTVAAMLSASRPCAWVASVDDRVVGFSMIDEEEGSLFAAFVLPAFEGRGIGRALIARAEAALFSQFDRIWLETDRNSRAAELYRRLGWRETSASGQDIHMEKSRPTDYSPSSSG